MPLSTEFTDEKTQIDDITNSLMSCLKTAHFGVAQWFCKEISVYLAREVFLFDIRHKLNNLKIYQILSATSFDMLLVLPVLWFHDASEGHRGSDVLHQ
jgi:hypothetical protein